MRSFVVVFLACGVATAAAAGQPRLPDTSTGVINGRVAKLVWPARYRDAKTHELLPAEGCVARLVPETDRDTVRSYPCGQWFAPPLGRYKYWIEGNGLISPGPILMHYAGEAFQGHGFRTVAPVVPAGFVRIADGVPVAGDQHLRLVSLGTEFFTDWMDPLDRRVSDARGLTPMPAGPVLAGIFDRKSDNALALARPANVAAGKTVVVRPLPPERDSDVLVILRRPIGVPRDDLRLKLTDARGSRPPDAFRHAPQIVIAVWYGASGSRATVTAESERLTLAPVDLTLPSKRVITHRGELRKKPSLEVSVVAPTDAFASMSLSVRQLDSREPLRTVPISGEPKYVIEGLPAGQLRVTLSADRWTFDRDADLRDGGDGVVSFALDPIILRGKVYLAREPARATIAFGDGMRELVKVETDAGGAYEAVFWEEALYVAHISLRDDDAEPFLDPAVPVERSRSVDFHIPGNRIVATVVDDRTGMGIAGAIVGVTSDAAHDEVGAMKIGQRHTADAEGKLVLPRLRPGRATIEATAPGYAASEARVVEIEADTKSELRFALTRLEPLRTVVLLPNGAPAAGASAIVVSDPTAGRQVWSGTANEAGELHIATSDQRGVVIVRHDSAASRVMSLASVGEQIRLAPADPAPLVVRSVDSTDRPVRFALLTVWIDGFRLCGPAAAFATWNRTSATDADGFWSGRNVPQAPLRLLATKTVAPAQIATAAYDGFADTISYPRPAGSLAIRAVE